MNTDITANLKAIFNIGSCFLEVKFRRATMTLQVIKWHKL